MMFENKILNIKIKEYFMSRKRIEAPPLTDRSQYRKIS